MSNSKNNKHIGYELLSMALFLGGAFCAASVGMSMWSDSGDAGNFSTAAIGALILGLGHIATFGIAAGCTVLGGVMFLRPGALKLSTPLAMLAGCGFALSLLVGAFSAASGGGLGGFLPEALGGIGGGIMNAVLAFGVAFLGAWLAIGAPIPQKRGKVVESNSVVAALSEVETDGVSEAEAEALFPELPTPIAAAPGVTEHEQRARGELPDGVRPIGSPTEDDHAPTQSKSDRAPKAGQGRPSKGAAQPKPLGADLADPEPADSVGTSKARAVTGKLADGVWTRTDEDEVRPLDTGDASVTALESSTPSTPSWESSPDYEEQAELEEEPETEAKHEDEAEEYELEDDVVAELDEDDSDDEEYEEEEEEYEEEDDLVAELDEDDSDDEEYEEEEEEEEEEDLVAELDEDESDEEEYEEEEEEEEEETAELEDDLVAELDTEEEDLEDVGEDTESSLEGDDEILGDLDDVEGSTPRPNWEQPGLFDADEPELTNTQIEVQEKSLVELDQASETSAFAEDPAMGAESEEDLTLLKELEALEAEEAAAKAKVEAEAEAKAEAKAAAEEKAAAEAKAAAEEEAAAEAKAAAEEKAAAEAKAAAEEKAAAEAKAAADEKAAAKAKAAAEAKAKKEAKAAAKAEAAAEAKAAKEAADKVETAEEESYVLPSQEAAAISDDDAIDEPEQAPSEPMVELSHEEKVFRSGELFLDQGRVAVSMLQRSFDMDFQEATGILDELQSMGLIGPYLGGTRRDILMTTEEWEALGAAR